MRPRRFRGANRVYRLEGGNEDNDLWVQQADGVIVSVWEPTDAERKAIADGANIELTVWGDGHPPCSVNATDVTLGKPPAQGAIE